MNTEPCPSLAVSQDWDELLSALRALPEGQFVAALPKRAAQAILAAPATVARWIATRAPELAARTSLRLLVIGAEKLDAVDAGRWYQLIPRLLGSALQIEVTLVGDRLRDEFRSPVHGNAPGKPARRYCGTLASYLAAPGAGGTISHLCSIPGFRSIRNGCATIA